MLTLEKSRLGNKEPGPCLSVMDEAVVGDPHTQLCLRAGVSLGTLSVSPLGDGMGLGMS